MLHSPAFAEVWCWYVRFLSFAYEADHLPAAALLDSHACISLTNLFAAEPASLGTRTLTWLTRKARALRKLTKLMQMTCA